MCVCLLPDEDTGIITNHIGTSSPCGDQNLVLMRQDVISGPELGLLDNGEVSVGDKPGLWLCEGSCEPPAGVCQSGGALLVSLAEFSPHTPPHRKPASHSCTNQIKTQIKNTKSKALESLMSLNVRGIL